MNIMTELENLMFLSLGTLLNTYFSPWSLPNLSEAQTFSPANANMVLNFLKSERHILVWKALGQRYMRKSPLISAAVINPNRAR